MLRNRENISECRQEHSETPNVLRRSRFFERREGYDDPSWQQPTGRFETRASASRWRKKFVTALTLSSATKHVGERLADCGAGHQCHSGTCPSCLRLLRRWLILEGEALLAARPSEKVEIAFFTLIPPFTRIAEGELAQFNLDAFKDRITHILKRRGLAEHPMLGGIDFSLNNTAAEKGDRYWQPHLHAMVLCLRGRSSFRKKAKKIPNHDASIVKVAVVETVKDLRSLIGYCLKATFDNRIPYYTDLGKPSVRKLVLKPNQMIELATYLDTLPIQGRLYLRNVRRRGSRLVTTSECKSSGRRRDSSQNPPKDDQRARLAA